jgi:AraC-like DNA-binding protein
LDIAKEWCVNPRTLQRRLEDSGTTYQQLLDEVRQDPARRLLAATDLESGEIAFYATPTPSALSRTVVRIPDAKRHLSRAIFYKSAPFFYTENVKLL